MSIELPTGCATGGTTSQVIEYTWYDAGVGSGVSFTINNAKGRQTKVAFQGGYYLYSYHADGHVERMYTKLDGLGGKTVAYSYDRQGNLTASLYQSGQSDLFRHVYTYDVAGRLNLVRGNNHATTQITEGTYTWWPDGGMKTELLRNQTNSFAYDARGRLAAINNTGSTATKFSAAYVWNPNSTLQISEYRQEGTIHTDKRYRHSFTYDGRNQLRTADYEYHNGSTWADRYDFDIGWIGYDRDGGITLMNRQNGSEVVDFEYAYVSGSHRLDYVLNNENYDIDDISHDRNGNITNGIGIDTTTYDWRNLPLSITVYNTDYPFIPSTYTHTYRYDHNGHRVYSSVDQTYSVRGAYGEPFAEYAGTTPVLKYWNYVRPDGVVIGRREGSNRFFYHRDHLGSTRTVLNASSTMVEAFDYMPFGEFMSGRITTSGSGTRPKFTGHAFDDETDLHNMQWRRQIPRYGVFRTPDPLADSYPGWNSYSYVMNDPMRFTDPDGRMVCCSTGLNSVANSVIWTKAFLGDSQSQDMVRNQVGVLATVASAAVAPIPTGVAVGLDVITNGGDNITGSAANAGVASSVMSLGGSRGRIAGATLGLAGEVLGGIANRAIGGEEILSTNSIIDDALVGASTGFFSNNLNSIVENATGRVLPNVSEGLRRGVVDIGSESISGSIGQVIPAARGIITTTPNSHSLNRYRPIVEPDKTRVVREFKP